MPDRRLNKDLVEKTDLDCETQEAPLRA